MFMLIIVSIFTNILLGLIKHLAFLKSTLTYHLLVVSKKLAENPAYKDGCPT